MQMAAVGRVQVIPDPPPHAWGKGWLRKRQGVGLRRCGIGALGGKWLGGCQRRGREMGRIARRSSLSCRKAMEERKEIEMLEVSVESSP